MCALLCTTDDTDCSQMSWQHIHSAGGDKEVLPGARGQEEIGGRSREWTKEIEQTEDGRCGKWGVGGGGTDVVQRSVWAKEVLTLRKM